MAGRPSTGQLDALRVGTPVEGVHVKPKAVRLAAETPAASGAGRAGRSSGKVAASSTVVVEVAEGRKHEVRLLVAAAGLELLKLKRVRVGGLMLPRELRPGGYQELSAAQCASVLQQRQQQQQRPRQRSAA